MNRHGSQDDDAHRFAGSRAYRVAAQQHLAFGVSSSPRASQRPAPVAIARAEGVRLTDIDGNRYIDYALGYGPLILGHSHPAILDAVRGALDLGLRTASVHCGEAELADRIAACVPGGELSALVSTGSEAVQLALRVARAATGRNRVLKCRANYHGWLDSLQVANAPGNDGPATIGQDPGASRSVTVVDWGDADAVEAVLDSSFAAVIVEAAAVNAGCFEPPAGYLQRLRESTARHGVMLIFDEVITGFRHALGGAQERYGVTPDLTVLGKALGAGLPIGAVSGTQQAMAPIASGRLVHRGTFNGNPLSTAAAIACLDVLTAGRQTIFPRIDGFAATLCSTIRTEAQRTGVAIHAQQSGPALQIFAGVRAMEGMAGLARVDRDRTVDFTAELLRAGVFTLPRGLMYLSAAHTPADIAETQTAIAQAMTAYAARLDAAAA